MHRFIITGLSTLLDALLIHSAPGIPAMNAHGCGRLQLNVLVLQQNLKNVEPNAILSRSAFYYDMFTNGPAAIIDAAKTQGKNLGFTYDEMKVLLDLCYSEALRSERRDIVVQAERGLEENVLALSEYLW
jgi:exocyst complex component 4